MPELLQASQNGRALEAFAVGTAAVVVPVESIAYGEHEITFESGDGIGHVAKVGWNTRTGLKI